MATLDLTGGAPTVDDAAVAAAAAAAASNSVGGSGEVIIPAPASLEESIVAVLDPDQGGAKFNIKNHSPFETTPH